MYLRFRLCRCLRTRGMVQNAGGAQYDPTGSPKPWVGSLTVGNDPRHSSPGENRFKQDQEVKRSARKARQQAKQAAPRRQTGAPDPQVCLEAAGSTESSVPLASFTAAAPSPAPPPSPVPLKPHKLSDVIGALWPQWVGQFGLVTGPSSMGIVEATAADLSLVRPIERPNLSHCQRLTPVSLPIFLRCCSTSLDVALHRSQEPWRGDSDVEDDPNMRCWVWDDALAAERNQKHKRYLPKGPR